VPDAHWGSGCAVQGQQVSEVMARRTLDQNALMWKLLGELSSQVNWHGNRLDSTEWKCVLTAALKRQKVVPGIDGGFVVIGQSTSRMTKQELSEVIELAYAFGAQHGVRFEADE
jgi:hypothetical protein